MVYYAPIIRLNPKIDKKEITNPSASSGLALSEVEVPRHKIQ